MSNRLRISLVIPAYNEESHLADCLEAVQSQREPFYEIIVVDNNSIDETIAIARQFPGVRVISEKRQGVLHARTTGFNAAVGEIIARIDADTLLPDSWSKQLAAIFNDSKVDAVSGAIYYHDVAAHAIVDPIDFKLRSWLASKMPERMFLLGANMAIRRTAWRQVADHTCKTAVHEDLDLAVHLAGMGSQAVFAPELIAGVSGRRIDTNIIDFARYLHSLPYTYALHRAREQRYMYPVAAIVLLHYLPLRILFRGYDETQQKFSLRKLFAVQDNQRVNPVTFID